MDINTDHRDDRVVKRRSYRTRHPYAAVVCDHSKAAGSVAGARGESPTTCDWIHTSRCGLKPSFARTQRPRSASRGSERISRILWRALCNWDLELPTEQPRKFAISRCSYPATSWSRKMRRYPFGNSDRARFNANRSTHPANRTSLLGNSLGAAPPSCSPAPGLSTETVHSDFLRKCISTVFTVTRYSQVERAASARNADNFRKTWRKASCVRSSASAVLRVIRRQSAYTRALCFWKRTPNASGSPACARRITSDSNTTGIADSLSTQRPLL